MRHLNGRVLNPAPADAMMILTRHLVSPTHLKPWNIMSQRLHHLVGSKSARGRLIGFDLDCRVTNRKLVLKFVRGLH